MHVRFLFLGVGALLAATLPAAGHAQTRRFRPQLERVEPAAAVAGSEIAIIGSQFSDSDRFFLGEVELPRTAGSHRPTRIVVTVPPNAQSGNIALRLADGSIALGPTFRVLASADVPNIADVSPQLLIPGGTCTINGTNFSARSADNTVEVGDSLWAVERATPTRLIVRVPLEAASGNLSVRTPLGRSTTQAIVVAPALRITGTSPTLVSPGGVVTISGAGFGSNARELRVRLGTRNIPIQSLSDTTIVVAVPANHPLPEAGTQVTFDISRGPQRASSSAVSVRRGPLIRRLSVPRVTHGDTFDADVQNLGTDVRRVRATLGAQTLRIRNLEGNRLTLEVPDGAISGHVEVHVEGLPSARSLQALEVFPRPTIRSFTPQSGPVRSEIQITGDGFLAGPVTAQLGDSPLEVVNVTATTITARLSSDVPSNAIRVSVGAHQAQSGSPFVVTHPPVIEGVAPLRVSPLGTLTITGSRFGSRERLSVTLGETSLEVISLSPSQLEVRLPANATSGVVVVSSRGEGNSAPSRSVEVIAPFTVATSLGVHGGQRVELRGTGFVEGRMRLMLPGQRAPVAYTFANQQVITFFAPAAITAGNAELIHPDGRRVTFAITINPPPTPSGIARAWLSCTPRGRCQLFVRGWGFGSNRRVIEGRWLAGLSAGVAGAAPPALRLTAANQEELVFAYPPAGLSPIPAGRIPLDATRAVAVRIGEVVLRASVEISP